MPVRAVLSAAPAPGAFCAPERSARGAGLRTIRSWDTRWSTRDNLHNFQRPGVAGFRGPSAASTNCSPGDCARRGEGPCAARCVMRSRCSMKTGPCCKRPLRCGRPCCARDWQRLFIETAAPLSGRGPAGAVRPRLAGKAGFTTKTDGGARLSSAEAMKIHSCFGWLAGAGHAAPALGSKPFAPLPVLGVPGWWPGNERAEISRRCPGVSPAPHTAVHRCAGRVIPRRGLCDKPCSEVCPYHSAMQSRPLKGRWAGNPAIHA